MQIRTEKWAEVLAAECANDTFKRSRNDIAWFLLLCVMTGEFEEPLKSLPKDGPLPKLPPHSALKVARSRRATDAPKRATTDTAGKKGASDDSFWKSLIAGLAQKQAFPSPKPGGPFLPASLDSRIRRGRTGEGKKSGHSPSRPSYLDTLVGPDSEDAAMASSERAVQTASAPISRSRSGSRARAFRGQQHKEESPEAAELDKAMKGNGSKEKCILEQLQRKRRNAASMGAASFFATTTTALSASACINRDGRLSSRSDRGKSPARSAATATAAAVDDDAAGSLQARQLLRQAKALSLAVEAGALKQHQEEERAAEQAKKERQPPPCCCSTSQRTAHASACSAYPCSSAASSAVAGAAGGAGARANMAAPAHAFSAFRVPAHWKVCNHMQEGGAEEGAKEEGAADASVKASKYSSNGWTLRAHGEQGRRARSADKGKASDTQGAAAESGPSKIGRAHV